MASAAEYLSSILSNLSEIQDYGLDEYVTELEEIDTKVAYLRDDVTGDGAETKPQR